MLTFASYRPEIGRRLAKSSEYNTATSSASEEAAEMAAKMSRDRRGKCCATVRLGRLNTLLRAPLMAKGTPRTSIAVVAR